MTDKPADSPSSTNPEQFEQPGGHGHERDILLADVGSEMPVRSTTDPSLSRLDLVTDSPGTLKTGQLPLPESAKSGPASTEHEQTAGSVQAGATEVARYSTVTTGTELKATTATPIVEATGLPARTSTDREQPAQPVAVDFKSAMQAAQPTAAEIKPSSTFAGQETLVRSGTMEGVARYTFEGTVPNRTDSGEIKTISSEPRSGANITGGTAYPAQESTLRWSGDSNSRNETAAKPPNVVADSVWPAGLPGDTATKVATGSIYEAPGAATYDNRTAATLAAAELYTQVKTPNNQYQQVFQDSAAQGKIYPQTDAPRTDYGKEPVLQRTIPGGGGMYEEQNKLALNTYEQNKLGANNTSYVTQANAYENGFVSSGARVESQLAPGYPVKYEKDPGAFPRLLEENRTHVETRYAQPNMMADSGASRVIYETGYKEPTRYAEQVNAYRTTEFIPNSTAFGGRPAETSGTLSALQKEYTPPTYYSYLKEKEIDRSSLARQGEYFTPASSQAAYAASQFERDSRVADGLVATASRSYGADFAQYSDAKKLYYAPTYEDVRLVKENQRYLSDHSERRVDSFISVPNTEIKPYYERSTERAPNYYDRHSGTLFTQDAHIDRTKYQDTVRPELSAYERRLGYDMPANGGGEMRSSFDYGKVEKYFPVNSITETKLNQALEPRSQTGDFRSFAGESRQQAQRPSALDGRSTDVRSSTEPFRAVSEQIQLPVGPKAETLVRHSEPLERQSEPAGRQTEISGRQTEISGRQTEISGRQTEVSGRQTEVSGHQTEVSTRPVPATVSGSTDSHLLPSDHSRMVRQPVTTETQGEARLPHTTPVELVRHEMRTQEAMRGAEPSRIVEQPVSREMRVETAAGPARVDLPPPVAPGAVRTEVLAAMPSSSDNKAFARTSVDDVSALGAKSLMLDGRQAAADSRIALAPAGAFAVDGRTLDGKLVLALDGKVVAGDIKVSLVTGADGRVLLTSLMPDGRMTGDTRSGALPGLPDGRVVSLPEGGKLIPGSTMVGADGRVISLMPDGRGAILQPDGRQIAQPEVKGVRPDGTTVRPDGPVSRMPEGPLPGVRTNDGVIVKGEQQPGVRGLTDIETRVPSDKGLTPNGKVLTDADGRVIATNLTGAIDGRGGKPLPGSELGLDDGAEEELDGEDGPIRIRKVRGDKRYLIGVEIALAGLLTAAAVARHRSEGEEVLNGNIDPASVLPDVQVAEEQTEPSPQEVTLASVMARRTYMVEPGDTLQSIAEKIYRDSALGWLIADINAGAIKESTIDGKRIVELSSRQLLELPDYRDIQAFRSQAPRDVDFGAIVTIVTENNVDKELLQSFLGRVTGEVGAAPKPAAHMAKSQETPEVKPISAVKLNGNITPQKQLAALLRGIPEALAAVTRNQQSNADEA